MSKSRGVHSHSAYRESFELPINVYYSVDMHYLWDLGDLGDREAWAYLMWHTV